MQYLSPRLLVNLSNLGTELRQQFSADTPKRVRHAFYIRAGLPESCVEQSINNGFGWGLAGEGYECLWGPIRRPTLATTNGELWEFFMIDERISKLVIDQWVGTWE